ncbi:MAG: hypothetical protein ACLU99_12280 [Alphaproteobacteria bacterium]
MGDLVQAAPYGCSGISDFITVFLSYSADAADFGATNPHIQYIIGLKGIAIMIVITPTKRQYIRQAKPSKITFRTMPQIFKAFVAVAFLIVVSIVIIF